MALVLGLECRGASPPLPIVLGAIVAGVAAFLAFEGAGRRRLARFALLAAATAFGVFLGEMARRDQDACVSAWLPVDGSAVEGTLEGTVIRAAQRDADGNRWLVADIGPARRASAPRRPARAKIVVRDSAPEAMRHVDALRRGDRFRTFARTRRARPADGPRGVRGGAVAAAQGFDATASVKSPRLVERTLEGRNGLGRLLDRALARLRRGLDVSVGSDGPERAVLGAMVLGDRASLDRETLSALRDAGLIHLLAISGLHVGMLALTGVWVMRRMGAKGVSIPAIAIPSVVAFTVLVGGAPSVRRASLAASVALVGSLLGRRGEPLNTLAVVAAALACLEPRWLDHVGYRLSVAATAGIIGLAGPLASMLPFPRIVALGLATSTSAYLATAPLCALHLNRLSPVAILSNLVAVPLCAVSLLTGAAAALLGGRAMVVGELAEGAARALLLVSENAARLPLGSIRVPSPSPVLLAVVVPALLIEVLAPGGRLVWPRRLVLTVALIVLHLGPRPPARGAADLAVLDVGQGQAVVFLGPEGRCLLVDGGGSAAGRFDAGDRVVVPFLLDAGCRRLDAVVLSHDHDDHAGGLESVVRDIEVGELWIGAGGTEGEVSRRLAERARRRGAAIVLSERGRAAWRAGVRIEVLHPERDDRALDVNDRCVAVRVARSPTSAVLVPGDLEREGERRLVSREATLASAVLVAGHHGARESSTDLLLDAVDPLLVVVSVGAENRFGHPAPETIRRLKARGIRPLRTDRDGTIILRHDGRRWSWITTLPRATPETE